MEDFGTNDNAVNSLDTNNSDCNDTQSEVTSARITPVQNKRPRNVLRITTENPYVLSPISELALGLEDAKIATPKSGRSDNTILGECLFHKFI